MDSKKDTDNEESAMKELCNEIGCTPEEVTECLEETGISASFIKNLLTSHGILNKQPL